MQSTSSLNKLDDEESVHDGGKGLTGKVPNGIARLKMTTSERRRTILHSIPLVRNHLPEPRDPYPTLEEVPYMGLKDASFISKATWKWALPLLKIGYFRTLVARDLEKVPPEMESGVLAERLIESFEQRRKIDEAWNTALDDGTHVPNRFEKLRWRAFSLLGWGAADGKRKIGLARAGLEILGWQFWAGGVYGLLAQISVITGPLVTKRIILYSTQAYDSHHGAAGIVSPSIGLGLGLAIALAALQVINAFMRVHSYCTMEECACLMRGTLVACLYRKAADFSGASRIVISNGRLMNHIGTDITRIQEMLFTIHYIWISPVVLIVMIVILVTNIGPSALVGMGYLFLTVLPQRIFMDWEVTLRGGIIGWTDKRIKLLSEILPSMRIVKYFAWEAPYLEKIRNLRREEMRLVRRLLILESGGFTIFSTSSLLASVFSLVVYGATGHEQNPAVIFTTISLFSLAGIPFAYFPQALSSIANSIRAGERLTEVFIAETREPPSQHAPSEGIAVELEGAAFRWYSSTAGADETREEETTEHSAPTITTPHDSETVFSIRETSLKIPYGQLIAIVGPVGAGKSSLLNAIIGEMKRTAGSIKISGSLSYSAQVPWIQSASLRNNILFGQPFDQTLYDRVVEASCLKDDFDMLPAGDATEIGEKGVTLSGGQKARVSLARTLYCDGDIVLLDDPLSAVDAGVGRHLFEKAICDTLRGKTRILVTHALQFLPQVDRIITLDQGRIVQDGTYAELIADTEGAFSKLLLNFKGHYSGAKENAESPTKAVEKVLDAEETVALVAKEAVVAEVLMQEEDREEGAVSKRVYWEYLKATRNPVTLGMTLLVILLLQVSAGLGAYWLVWWQDDKFKASRAIYVGVYGALGVTQAGLSFAMGICIAAVGYNGSRNLHDGAIRRILHAPMSFFDTTPLGRIVNRFSSDIDTLDIALTQSLLQAIGGGGAILVSFVLISIVQPYFLTVGIALMIVYMAVVGFYRASSRELKRIGNVFQSATLANFSESLVGLPTIRAFGAIEKSLRRHEYNIDLQNRARLLQLYAEQWMGLQLGGLGVCLIFANALFVVGAAKVVSPTQGGLMLSFVLNIQGTSIWFMTRLAALEMEATSAERILHFSNNVEQEAPVDIEATRPPQAWPQHGAINFNNVVMRYRPELPPVLKGLDFKIGAGMKIGIVGRTGAGKSSILQALFRITELDSGNITIDGIDISTLGLHQLREKLAIIPQDPLLFSGTLRSNLDPFDVYEDRILWDALRRAHLVKAIDPFSEDPTKSEKAPTSGRFKLDMVIEDEGSNLSVGERSLVSLARALVRNSKIIVLDECTASVDVETDAKVQETIRSEFHDKTLLIIAHRLRTIIDLSAILVMDNGQAAEFGKPLDLFRNPSSIFRVLCERSNISEQDLMAKNAF